MNRFLKTLILFLIFLVVFTGVFLFLHKSNKEGSLFDDSLSKSFQDDNIITWLGINMTDFQQEMGKATYSYKSPYGGLWKTYINNDNQFIQVHAENDEVDSVFVLGDELNIPYIYKGMTYTEINRLLQLYETITFKKGLSQYTFQLKDDDIIMRPIVKIDDKAFLQLYFDTVKAKLIAIRIIDGDTLLKYNTFEIKYSGDLPVKPTLDLDDLKNVNDGMRKDILNLTNIIRRQFDLSTLKENNTLNQLALSHSRDMEENDYFSHISLNGDGLKARLDSEQVSYKSAGENIAAHYPDTAGVMIGWLNSMGHRKILLNPDFTDIGIGVYKFNYTQDYIKGR